MELTIEQALQQGIAAHKEGNLQEAERLYRAILKSQPLHPDANHNLGIIAVSVGKAEAALLFFKIALDANPKIEQFWLSYIKALIEEKQFEKVKQVVEQAKKQGLEGERLNALEAQLVPKTEIEGVSSASPSQQQLNSLLEYYQNGRFSEAEKLAISITNEYPEHQFAWKVLGAIFRQIDRKEEAVNANQKAAGLPPQDAEIHSNLGVTLQELGRLDEAAASYKQAIALNPDFVEAHYNVGTILEGLGRLDEAAENFRQAIALRPDSEKFHSKLLTCLYALDKPTLFFDALDSLINQDKVNSVIGSFICRSALKYGIKRSNVFCKDPLTHVLHTDLNSQYNFKKVFVEKVRSILNKEILSNRKQSLVTKGYQTFGNLFDIENKLTEEIQKAIRLEIEKYRIKFKNSEEGFIKRWPADYVLYGWIINMRSGGELLPHIHQKGWLSGSLYINVPLKSQSDSGNLVVALGEEKDATNTRLNSKKIIELVTGNLVLFPASLTHYTIPFESEDERIVIAFDMIAK